MVCSLPQGNGGPRRFLEPRDEPVDEADLALEELALGRGGGQPCRAVNLRPRPRLARVRRPLQLELVAHDGVGVEVALHGPDADPLTARLADLAEVEPGTGGRLLAQLLGEFPACCLLRFLIRRVLSLRNRPGTIVLLGPEGAARMHEEQFEDSPVAKAVGQQAGTACWSLRIA